MRYGICIPQLVGDAGFDPAALRGYLADAERLGFHSAWTQEQVLGTLPMLSPLETMTWAAAATERIRLGCVVFVTPLHTPAHLAKALSSLDHLSGGRLEVGVGIGGPRAFAAFGIDGEGLVSRFTEGLALMKALWTEPSVTHHGRFWTLDGAGMEPKPVQRPHPPIWFGGGSEAALRRAVRLGDGFFGAGSTSIERFVGQADVVRAALDEAGRDPGSFGIAKRVYIAVGGADERRRTLEMLSRMYARFSAVDVEPLVVGGSPEQCAEQLRRARDAGAELLLFTPLIDEHSQMHRVAADVLPLLD